MSMRKVAIAVCVLACAIAGAARAESPRLGKPISQSDFAEWDINILPDGTNLPPGSGKAADGAKLFADKCALCHGDKGQGGIAVRLIGGPAKASLNGSLFARRLYSGREQADRRRRRDQRHDAAEGTHAEPRQFRRAVP